MPAANAIDISGAEKSFIALRPVCSLRKIFRKLLFTKKHFYDIKHTTTAATTTTTTTTPKLVSLQSEAHTIETARTKSKEHTIEISIAHTAEDCTLE